MYRQGEKYHRLNRYALSISIAFSLLFLIKTMSLFIVFSLLSLSLSLFLDALIILHSHQKRDAIQQLIRAVLLLFLTALITFALYKGL